MGLKEDTGPVAGTGDGWGMSMFRWLGMMVGFVIFAVGALAVTYQMAYGERIVLGARLLNVDLGALSRDEARLVLADRFETYYGKPISLRKDDKSSESTPRELGVSYDIEDTLDAAYRVGRQGSLLDNLDAQLRTYRQGAALQPSFQIDEERQKTAFDGLARLVDKPATNASLALRGMEVAIVPGRGGYELDREALAKSLRERFSQLATDPVNMSLTAKEPSVKGPELDGMRQQLQQLIDKPVSLRFVSRRWLWVDGLVAQDEVRTWSLAREQVVGMLRFVAREAPGQGPAASLEIDKEKAAAYARELAREIDQEPRNARLQWTRGGVSPAAPSQEKRRLDVTGLVQRLGEVLTSIDKRVVEIPVNVEKAAVAMEDIPRMGINELIEERSTYTGGSIPERMHNIRLGAERLNGAVVPPGATFSFNGTVGEISEEKGYLLGFSILGGETVADPGGGICQVSTTVFQAVFWAGYPIVERHPHAYRMKRYEPPPGLDASVYNPGLDLKFRNNTGNYLLVQARTDDSRIYVALYGTKPGWDVTLVEPVLENVKPSDSKEIIQESPALERGRRVQVETPEDGVDVTLGRIVSREGRELLRDRFFSRYQPQRNVVVVGTGPEPSPNVPDRPASGGQDAP
ncbi:MAG: VanW family protein [Chloroflexi bacterium]|nr:VanW family protein [Chloroflexota bacterium]